MNKNDIIKILNDNSTNINEQQNNGIHKAVYCNDYTEVADAILRLIKSTQTFDEWKDKYVGFSRYYGWVYNGEYYDLKHLHLEYKKCKYR